MSWDVSARRLVDDSGVVWDQRDDGEAALKRVQRMLGDESVRAVRFGPGREQPVDVPVGKRAAYWQSVLPYLRRRGSEDFFRCAAYEFRSETGLTMVVFRESA